MSTTVEFAVQISCDSCVTKIESSLKDVQGVKNIKISKENGTVLVESNLPSTLLQEKIESTGRKAVLKGYGSDKGAGDGLHQSAVAMLGGTQGYTVRPELKGVVRFVQTNDQTCVIDGTLDGLSPGLHGLYVYQCGDLTQGCQSIGDHFDINGFDSEGTNKSPLKKHTGDLGNIEANEDGRAMFRFENNNIKVWDVIGRSIGVTEEKDTCSSSPPILQSLSNNPATRLACGIISRSAGLFENSKRICACDGVSIWDERDKPLAGPGRQSNL